MYFKKWSILFQWNSILTFFSFVHLMYALSTPIASLEILIGSILFLGVGISTSVHSAEMIAQRIGPSLGTLLLSLSVTIIEVALIINLMKSDPFKAQTIARDTVFATLMIVTNGIVGISILSGGLRYKEMGFQTVGTSSLMAVLTTLISITLILPNFTTSTEGPTYNENQLIFISLFSLFIYFALLWAQTHSHKNYFEPITKEAFKRMEEKKSIPSQKETVLYFVSLFLSLTVVVGLAKVLSPTIGSSLTSWGAPPSTVGILIALLVLAPETIAALQSAKANQLQTSLNLALGSGAATIALTLPIVSGYSLFTHQTLILGLDPKSVFFLLLTFLSSGFTFGSGRTTALHGIVHLVILMCYLLISFIP